MNTRVTLKGDRVTWRCERCGHVIRGGDGYIWMDRADAWAATADTSVPHARWQVSHTRCLRGDADEPVGAYNIETDRVRTVAEVEDWTRHLREKRWFAGCGWRELVAEIHGAATEGRSPATPLRGGARR